MNKFPHLSRYLEFLLHLFFWLLVAGIILHTYQNYWQNLMESHVIEVRSEDGLTTERTQHFFPDQNLDLLIRYFILIFFKAVFFYLNVFLIFPRFRHVEPKWKIILPLAINLSWAFLAELLLIKFFQREVFALHFDYDWRERYDFINEGLIPFLAVLGGSYIYWAARQWLLVKDDIQKLGKTNAELALLKNQVNPHFLFNTLNNLFAMAIERQADDLAESISQLTHLMRYSIYDSQVQYIELHREVEYLENYIKLQKLRFTSEDAVNIRFEVIGDTQSVRIAPMLLINFVENAFKHGVSLKHPSDIFISLTTTEDQIAFKVENAVHRQNKENAVQHAGFGLEHTKKLLEMQYPLRHQLQTTEENGRYKVSLILKLQKTKVEVMA
jgi:two-component system, LytTR family, sensor kinase